MGKGKEKRVLGNTSLELPLSKSRVSDLALTTPRFLGPLILAFTEVWHASSRKPSDDLSNGALGDVGCVLRPQNRSAPIKQKPIQNSYNFFLLIRPTIMIFA